MTTSKSYKHNSYNRYDDQEQLGFLRGFVLFFLVVTISTAAIQVFRTHKHLSGFFTFQEVVAVENRSEAEKWAEDCIPAGLNYGEKQIWKAVCEEKARKKFGELKLGRTEFKHGFYTFTPYEKMQYAERKEVQEWLKRPDNFSYRTNTNYNRPRYNHTNRNGYN